MRNAERGGRTPEPGRRKITNADGGKIPNQNGGRILNVEKGGILNEEGEEFQNNKAQNNAEGGDPKHT